MLLVIAESYSHYVNYCIANNLSTKTTKYVHYTEQVMGIARDTPVIVLNKGNRNVDMEYVKVRFANVKYE